MLDGVVDAYSAAIERQRQADGLRTDLTKALKAAFGAATGEAHERAVEKIEAMFAKQDGKHTTELEKVRSRSRWQMASLEQKIASMRSASAVEGQHKAVQLERMHRDALAKLERAMAEQAAEYERKAAEQAEVEAGLLAKISHHDGGAHAAMLERQRCVHHMAEAAVKRMRNAELCAAWETWADAAQDHVRMLSAARRMVNLPLVKALNVWSAACEEWARQQRMLSVAAARLTRPALTASFVLWRRDWETSGREAEAAEHAAHIAALQAQLYELRAEMDAKLLHSAAEQHKLREQLTVGLSDAEAQAAAARQAEIERLRRAAARRMMNRDLSRGWGAWLAQWEVCSSSHGHCGRNPCPMNP